MLDFRKIKTYPLGSRKNLVTTADFPRDTADFDPWRDRRFRKFCRLVAGAARQDRQVIFMMGAHVIKTGQSLLVIDLMRRGVITHVGMNGACSIHDFEMAFLGETSEDVAESIEDGSFGMAEETGSYINTALKHSRAGYGEAVGKMIVDKDLPYKEYSILAQAYRLGVPATVHVAIGTDIIHQHPTCDGAVLGRATFRDFKTIAESVAKMSHGAIMNFGSAVIMPEVFLKVLSISRNLGHKVAPITTANLDVRTGASTDWYYRPMKNVVVRPTSLGGEGFHFRVRHEVSIPSLHKLVLAELG